MSTHTKGPWRWTPDPTNYPAMTLHGSDDAVVLEVYESHGGGMLPTVGDARLIAAAPELLAALNELLTVGRSVIDARPECDWDRYSALLNKIEGAK